jgi:TrkA domain protein
VIGGLLIDWVTLDENSPGAGKTIAELQVRSETKMTIAAILRGHVPLVAPEPTEQLAAGDRLIVVGRQEDLAGFRRHVVRS